MKYDEADIQQMVLIFVKAFNASFIYYLFVYLFATNYIEKQ